MNAMVRLMNQRSVGEVVLRYNCSGVASLRENGAAKLRLPHASHAAILINTGGGLAGGDSFRFDISLAAGARLSLTSQAAERVYRSLGPAASVSTRLVAETDAELFWLPQETILFEGANLRRNYSVSLAATSRFLAVEPLIFGRTEMGENPARITLKDSWRIARDGHLVHAEDLSFDGALPRTLAGLGTARAMATIIYLHSDSASRLDAMRSFLSESDGASAWNGKLVVRLLAEDGFHLRKRLVPALCLLAGSANLPRSWTF